MSADQIGYSKWTLMPIDPKVTKAYQAYTRNQVQQIALKSIFVILGFSLFSLGVALYSKQFQQVSQGGLMRVEMVQFILSGSLCIFLFIVWLVSKRCIAVCDWIAPVYAVITTIFCLQYWQHPIAEPLTDTQSFPYNGTDRYLLMLNLLLSVFFSPHYPVSVAGRSLMFLNNFNIGLRLFLSKKRSVTSLCYDFLLYIVLIESICYYINSEKVKLFLEMTKSSYQEKQTCEILQSIPSSVMVINDEKKFIFQNKKATITMDQVCKTIKGPGRPPQPGSYDPSTYFLNKPIFRTCPSLVGRRNQRYQIRMVSVSMMLRDQSILSRSERFEIPINDAQAKKQTYSITMHQIILGDRPCTMIMLEDQTAFFDLQAEREERRAITLANQFISETWLEPLKRIDHTVIILNRDIQTEEHANMLESIKYCSRIIQFSVMDLRERFNQANQIQETKLESIDVREVVTDTVNFSKIPAQSRKQKLITIFEPSIPEFLETDPFLLQQTINNLLRNSIKVMPEETDVRIKIDFIDEQLRVAIEDNNETPSNHLQTDSFGDDETPREAQYSPMIRPMRGGPFDTVLATTDPGRKVFVASVPAQRVSDTVDSQRIVEEIEEEEEIKPRPKILFYETAIDRKIALERIFMIELRLGYHFEICTDGRQILDRVKTLFEETDYNQVALVVIDVEMTELVGSEVITQTRQFLQDKLTSPENLPHFAFKAQNFWEQPAETVNKIMNLGIKTADVLEEITSKQQVKKLFKRINYFYRQFDQTL